MNPGVESQVMRLSEVHINCSVLKDQAHHQWIGSTPRPPVSKGSVVIALACSKSSPLAIHADARNNPDITIDKHLAIGCEEALCVPHEGLTRNPCSKLQRRVGCDHHRQRESNAPLMPGTPDHDKVRLASPGQKHSHLSPSSQDRLGREDVGHLALGASAQIRTQRLTSLKQPAAPVRFGPTLWRRQFHGRLLFLFHGSDVS